PDVFFGHELECVSETLPDADGTGLGGAKALLETGDHFAFAVGQVDHHHRHHEHDDHDADDGVDPGRQPENGVGEEHHLSTSPSTISSEPRMMMASAT